MLSHVQSRLERPGVRGMLRAMTRMAEPIYGQSKWFAVTLCVVCFQVGCLLPACFASAWFYQYACLERMLHRLVCPASILVSYAITAHIGGSYCTLWFPVLVILLMICSPNLPCFRQMLFPPPLGIFASFSASDFWIFVRHGVTLCQMPACAGQWKT